MGLDSVEILVNVENAFGITIANFEAEKITTVGDIHSIVWRSVQGRQSMRCKSQQLYYKLRHVLVTRFKVHKDAVELTASLNDIFPKTNRRLRYRKLEKELQLKLPPLVLPPAWRITLRIAGLMMITGSLVFPLVMVNRFHYTRWLYVLPGLGILLTVFLSNLLDSARIVFKPAIVEDYTKQVLSLNYATLIQQNGANRKEVEVIINNIIAETIGLELSEISPEKKLQDDLGID
jgi:acyl carrier protein